MRNFRDRLRHALSFEIIGLLLITPISALLLDMPMEHIGVVTFGSATLAVIWTWIYNWGFDHFMQWKYGTTLKGAGLRVLHAVLFEIGLLILLAPLIVWWLEVGLLEALLLDAGFAVFYMVYAYAFNWCYDLVFPLPEWSEKA